MIHDLARAASVYTTLPKEKGQLVFYALSGCEELGHPYRYDATLLSTNPNLGLSEILGQPICIELQLPNGGRRPFSGYVTHFSFIGETERLATYHVVIEPWLALLRKRIGSRAFPGTTVPAVIEQLFREHGFSDFSNKLRGTYRKFDHLVQYRESDLQFVLRIMQQEGIYFYFNHGSEKQELVLADDCSAHQAAPHYADVPYYPAQDNERRERDHLHSWHVRRHVRPAAVTVRDFNFTRPSSPVSENQQVSLEHAFNEYEIYDYPGEFSENADAAVQAKIRLEQAQSSFERMRCIGNARGMRCGALFSLKKYPRDDQNKEYLIVRTHHTISVANYSSIKDPKYEPVVRVELVVQDGKTPFRAKRKARAPVIAGPQTATVVGPTDQDIWTDPYGRVLVRFHWDREGIRDAERPCWVRVSHAWAGKNWGTIHIPRIGQEVVVNFLEGNPNCPIVTGSVYNADNMPPYELTKNQTQSGIKTQSTKGGTPDNFNELRFEDKKGQEELFMQAEKNMTVNVKNDRTTTIGRNDTLNITGDQFIKIHGNLSMIVEGVTEKNNPDKTKPVKSSLGVTGAHRIDASDTIDIQAPNKITLTCGDSVLTMVPGKITLTTAGSTIAIDPNIFAKSSGNTEVMLDTNAFMKASGGASMLLDANACTQSNGKSQMLLDGDAALTTSGTVSLHGAKITGKGDTEAGLDGGGSTIALTAASADVAGNQVNVNAKAVASIGGPMVKIG